MSDLEKLKAWIAKFPDFDILGKFRVDYTDQIPGNGGMFPSGQVEIRRRTDILGTVTVENQYNFGLYYVFAKDPGDDVGASINAEWIMSFQRWVQEQSIKHLAPTFGDVPNAEYIQAQNGSLYESDEEGTATYMVQLSVYYTKIFLEENEWLI